MTTDSNGSFTFKNIAPGSYIVAVFKANYAFIPEYFLVTVEDKNIAVPTFIGSTINADGNAGDSLLYPFKTGSNWIYDSVDLISTITINSKMINQVTGTKVMGGKLYWVVTSTEYDSDGDEDSKDTANFRIENDILYTYGTDFLTAKAAFKAATTVQAAALLKLVQVGSIEYPLIKFDVSAGSTWDIYKESSSYQGNTASIISTGKYYGTETVGAYSNCAKYEITYSSEAVTSSMKIAESG